MKKRSSSKNKESFKIKFNVINSHKWIIIGMPKQLKTNSLPWLPKGDKVSQKQP